MTNARPLLNEALEYARRGWCIIPVIAKKPPTGLRWKEFQTTRPTESVLRRLFESPTITGLAVLLGPASGGLAVRDFDRMEAFDKWAASYSRFAAKLPTVGTSRGRHVYCQGPEGFHDFGDGEYRATAGHYVVLPPSLHASGKQYEWLIPLPAGPLPEIDPVKAGLLPLETERTEKTERPESNGADRASRADREKQRTTEAIGDATGGAVCDPAVQDAIASTLPSREGERNRRLFDLARKLKAIPALASAEPPLLRPIVKEWHRQALPAIQTKEFLDTWTDFVMAWPRVKFPAGQGTIELAFQEAVSSKPDDHVAALYDDPRILALACLCRTLQKRAGNADFYIDCRTAGRLLAVPHTTAWRWLTVLCADGVLKAGPKGSQATRKASRFRYVA